MAVPLEGATQAPIKCGGGENRTPVRKASARTATGLVAVYCLAADVPQRQGVGREPSEDLTQIFEDNVLWASLLLASRSIYRQDTKRRLPYLGSKCERHFSLLAEIALHYV